VVSQPIIHNTSGDHTVRSLIINKVSRHVALRLIEAKSSGVPYTAIARKCGLTHASVSGFAQGRHGLSSRALAAYLRNSIVTVEQIKGGVDLTLQEELFLRTLKHQSGDRHASKGLPL
jgi:hypothetical protein